MKRFYHFACTTACIAFFFLAAGCNSSPSDKTAEVKSDSTQSTTTKTSSANLKAEIQERETAWSVADNARDVNTLADFYADDAVSSVQNEPMLVGKAAIKKDIETSMQKRTKGSSLVYEVKDAYGCDNYATELGTTTRKDSAGKIIYTGKYMALWEKRNGKWICIRDIANDDVKEK